MPVKEVMPLKDIEKQIRQILVDYAVLDLCGSQLLTDILAVLGSKEKEWREKTERDIKANGDICFQAGEIAANRKEAGWLENFVGIYTNAYARMIPPSAELKVQAHIAELRKEGG